jgi:hypothetical protein
MPPGFSVPIPRSGAPRDSRPASATSTKASPASTSYSSRSFDRIVADGVAAVLTAANEAPRTAQDQAHAIVSTFVTSLTDDPRKARVGFIEAMGSEALMRRRLDALQDLANLISTHALEFHASTGLDPIGAAVKAQILSGGLIEAIIAWLEGRLDITRDQLIKRCTTLFIAAAGVPTA